MKNCWGLAGFTDGVHWGFEGGWLKDARYQMNYTSAGSTLFSGEDNVRDTVPKTSLTSWL